MSKNPFGAMRYLFTPRGYISIFRIRNTLWVVTRPRGSSRYESKRTVARLILKYREPGQITSLSTLAVLAGA